MTKVTALFMAASPNFASKLTMFMKSANLKTKRNPRVRYHLSEQLTAGLSYAKEKGNFLSWEDFFSALLHKWNNEPQPIPLSNAHSKFKVVEQKLDALDSHVAQVHGLIEAQVETFCSLNQELTHGVELTRRIQGLLSLALGFDPDHFNQPETKSKASESNNIIQQIRKRRFS